LKALTAPPRAPDAGRVAAVSRRESDRDGRHGRDATVRPIGLDAFRTAVLAVVEVASLLIEVLAVAIIVVAIMYASILAALRAVTGRGTGDGYSAYRVRLGRALLLGLEVLVAADIIRTVALQPTLANVFVLGLLVVVRTFLSWSLIVEIEGRWPWQRHGAGQASSVT
jgi:uncharacterized membrane protein